MYSYTVADTLRGDKGMKTVPVDFAEQVCIKCSCLADQLEMSKNIEGRFSFM